MTEKDVQMINKETYTDEESTEQKVIFDINIFEQIKGTSKRMKNIDENIGTSQLSRKSVEYQRIKEIEPYHYIIKRAI